MSHELATAWIVDACQRLDVPFQFAPPGLRPVIAGARISGPALPARHFGSVDVFLEAFEHAEPGHVLVIDNAGRLDEACIGDLIALEARAAGLAGMLVWGCHRDTLELREIGLPVFSYGALPCGPRRLDPRSADVLERAPFGEAVVSNGEHVFADDDGAVFLAAADVERVREAAAEVHAAERRQAEALRGGRTLRDQFAFTQFLERRSREPDLSFARHLHGLKDAAIGEGGT